MNLSKNTRRAIFSGSLALTAIIFSHCAGTSSQATGGSLTTSQKITAGLGSATTVLQSMGTALGSHTSSFSVGGAHLLSTANSCTIHADPGNDANSDGVVSDSERYNTTDPKYALTKFYCTLAQDTNGPESISGSMKTLKMVACAVDKNLGGISFDGTSHALSTITIDTSCASADQLKNMNNGVATTSVVMNIAVHITAAKNPTFSEFPSNTYYSHGLKIASDDNTSLKYIILAKFDDTVSGDPTEQADFEFATYGTGTQMQGTGVEYAAGKIHRTAAGASSGSLWYESRVNRIKSNINDAVCQPGSASSSCGFARHTRIKTDISFSGGDIADVSNMSGIVAEGYDSTGSGQSGNFSFMLTAKGSLASGITGKAWQTNPGASPVAMSSATATSGFFDTPVLSCITGGGSITTTCGSAPAPLEYPTDVVDSFFRPANSASWLDYLGAHGGLGYSTDTDLSDTQSAL